MPEIKPTIREILDGKHTTAPNRQEGRSVEKNSITPDSGQVVLHAVVFNVSAQLVATAAKWQGVHLSYGMRGKGLEFCRTSVIEDKRLVHITYDQHCAEIQAIYTHSQSIHLDAPPSTVSPRTLLNTLINNPDTHTSVGARYGLDDLGLLAETIITYLT